MVDEFPQAQMPGEGGWQEQTGIGDDLSDQLGGLLGSLTV